MGLHGIVLASFTYFIGWVLKMTATIAELKANVISRIENVSKYSELERVLKLILTKLKNVKRSSEVKKW